MIVLHVSGSNWNNCAVSTLEWQTFNAYDGAVRWCIPVFVMLSGMFMLNPGKELTIKKLYLKNILRIAVSLLFWGTIYPFLNNYIICGNINPVFFIQGFKAIITGNPWYHLWFLYMLIGLYIITPVLRVFVANASKGDVVYFLTVSFIFAGLFPFLIRFYPFDRFAKLLSQLNLDIIIGYSGFYVLGYYLSKYDFKRATKIIIYVLGILGVAVTVTGTSLISLKNGVASQLFYDYSYPNIIVTAIAVFLVFKNVFREKEYSHKVRSVIFALSRCSFGIYLLHDIFNIFLRSININTLSFSPILSVPLISLTIFVLGIIFSYPLTKLPFINRYIV